MIVTAGLGTSGVPLRIGVPPEFVMIDVAGS
jgi:predicted MPP superfamily phosphohydrolase